MSENELKILVTFV